MMVNQTFHQDIPATPSSLIFNDVPRSYQVQNFSIGLENPIDVDAVKSFLSNSIMLKLPLFTSLLVKQDKHYYWRRTQVDINQHFTVVNRHSRDLDEEEAEDALNDYLAELASDPVLDTLKPLWEMHALLHLRVLVLRVHHAIGDGTSIASLIREIGREHLSNGKKTTPVRPSKQTVGCFKRILLTMGFMVDSSIKFFLVKGKKTVLNAKSYVHNWPQKLATVRFHLEDIKLVKNLVPNSTINDILCGVIWSGFIKYINARSSTGLKGGEEITGVLVANLRAQSGLMDISELIREGTLESLWGNKFGIFLLPLSYTNDISNPVDYVRQAKYMLDKKKSSMESFMSSFLRDMVLRLCGLKVLTNFTTKTSDNTTFLFSNVMGPSEQISFAENPVNYIRLSCSISPMRITMHLMSYKNNLDMQIMVAEDVIPDSKFLASCFQDSLEEMKSSINHIEKSD